MLQRTHHTEALNRELEQTTTDKMINDTSECSYMRLVYWEHSHDIQLSIYDSFGYTYSSPLITH